ncbi:MAG: lysophospholipid acyltransferase family protein [Acidobacteriota bacterium]|nr:1-acyl-sn-glycerol-3-phosphate acyltransferase [Blastocatellia bacterium]MDW8411460.1 lysophospholipid acyltransferase family protein [Acidobacteriota bacterium]
MYWLVKILKILFLMFFRLFFTVEYLGVENIPSSGPAVLAANHPSYLDPVLIYVVSERPIRFLAWDKLFQIPILGFFLRLFGAIPVNVYSKDSNAFEQAMQVLRQGDLLGVFPEAGRSQQGYMESLKSGAARLAIFNNCPIVPITITGAYEAWPVHRLLPLPRKIMVRFWQPIQPGQEWQNRRNDPDFHRELMERWREVVNRQLIPGLKAHERRDKLFAQPAWHLRIFEIVPLGALLIMLFSKVPKLWLMLPATAYYLYLLADIHLLPQGRISKVLRDLSAPILMVAWTDILAYGVEMPQAEHFSLLAVMSALMLPYYWTSYYDTQRYLRGLTLAFYLNFVLQLWYPFAYGLHVALPLYTACYAVYHQHLHWYSQLIVVCSYVTGVVAFLPTRPEQLLPYVLLCPIIVAYMKLVKFTAHDGRQI